MPPFKLCSPAPPQPPLSPSPPPPRCGWASIMLCCAVHAALWPPGSAHLELLSSGMGIGRVPVQMGRGTRCCTCAARQRPAVPILAACAAPALHRPPPRPRHLKFLFLLREFLWEIMMSYKSISTTWLTNSVGNKHDISAFFARYTLTDHHVSLCTQAYILNLTHQFSSVRHRHSSIISKT